MPWVLVRSTLAVAKIDRFRHECQPRPVDVDTPCRNSVPKPPLFRNPIRPFSARS